MIEHGPHDLLDHDRAHHYKGPCNRRTNDFPHLCSCQKPNIIIFFGIGRPLQCQKLRDGDVRAELPSNKLRFFVPLGSSDTKATIGVLQTEQRN